MIFQDLKKKIKEKVESIKNSSIVPSIDEDFSSKAKNIVPIAIEIVDHILTDSEPSTKTKAEITLLATEDEKSRESMAQIYTTGHYLMNTLSEIKSVGDNPEQVLDSSKIIEIIARNAIETGHIPSQEEVEAVEEKTREYYPDQKISLTKILKEKNEEQKHILDKIFLYLQKIDQQTLLTFQTSLSVDERSQRIDQMVQVLYDLKQIETSIPFIVDIGFYNKIRRKGRTYHRKITQFGKKKLKFDILKIRLYCLRSGKSENIVLIEKESGWIRRLKQTFKIALAIIACVTNCVNLIGSISDLVKESQDNLNSLIDSVKEIGKNFGDTVEGVKDLYEDIKTIRISTESKSIVELKSSIQTRNVLQDLNNTNTVRILNAIRFRILQIIRDDNDEDIWDLIEKNTTIKSKWQKDILGFYTMRTDSLYNENK